MSLDSKVKNKIELLKSSNDILISQLKRKLETLQDTNLLELTENVADISQLNIAKVGSLKAHYKPVRTGVWSKDSNHIATVGEDNYLIIWNSKTFLKEQFEELQNDDEYVFVCDILASNQLVVCGGLNNKVTVFRIGSGLQNSGLSVVCRFKGHTDCITDVKFLNDQQILSSLSDRSCRLWDIKKGVKLRSFTNHYSDVTSLSVNPIDENLFLSSLALDCCVRLFDLRVPGSGIVSSFEPAGKEATVVEYFPNGTGLVVGTKDSNVNFYDTRVGNAKIEQYQLPISSRTQRCLADTRSSSSSLQEVDGVESMSFSKSGRTLFVCTPDTGCVALDVLKGRIIQLVDSRSSLARVSPDGNALLCVNDRGNEVDIWTYY